MMKSHATSDGEEFQINNNFEWDLTLAFSLGY